MLFIFPLSLTYHSLHLRVVINPTLNISNNLVQCSLGSGLLVRRGLGLEGRAVGVGLVLEVVQVLGDCAGEAVGLEVGLLALDDLDGVGDVGLEGGVDAG